MHYPSVRWNSRLKAFQCPCCHAPIMMEQTEDKIKYKIPAGPPFFLRENTKNHKCKACGTVLWAPLCKPLHSGLEFSLSPPPSGMGSFGFVHRNFLGAYRDLTTSPQVMDVLERIQAGRTGDGIAKGACRRFPLSSFIKKKMKGKIDGLIIAGKLHEYAHDSGQGDAMAEIAGTAKKVVGMTATLINGYASGIFHLLFRLLPNLIDHGRAGVPGSTAFLPGVRRDGEHLRGTGGGVQRQPPSLPHKERGTDASGRLALGLFPLPAHTQYSFR